jgi:beta-xylosidase
MAFGVGHRSKQLTYQNPIVGGPEWIRDGFILKVGETYYLTGTTGNAGVRLWISDNLTKWSPIDNGDDGYILRNEAIPWTKEKIWAPEIFYHKPENQFYLTVNCRYDGDWHGQGLAIAVADSIRGPYLLKTVDRPLTGNNDASLFLDDDGQCYLVQTNCVLCKIDLETPKLLTPKYRLVDFGQGKDDWDYEEAINEGPCLRKVDGTYYLFWTCNRWGNFVGYAKSKKIWDERTDKPPKFVKNPKNPIFGAARPPYEQHDPPGCPFDEAGHGTPFIGPDGRYWISGFCKSFKRGSPYTTPRLFIDPLNYDPQTGEFTGQVTWTPQTVVIQQRETDLPSQPEQLGYWRIPDAPLLTPWAVDVSPQNALPEYPRPQMVRSEWQNLNGLWQYAKADIGENINLANRMRFAWSNRGVSEMTVWIPIVW